MAKFYLLYFRAMAKLRALFFNRLFGTNFGSMGRHCKIRGRTIQAGRTVNIGDNCWIEAVTRYPAYSGMQSFNPVINFGAYISLSDAVHISSVERIDIGDFTLIGSRVYIGDHSHGSYMDENACAEQSRHSPISRPLADIAPITIGQRCWIGDGAVILAGASIGNNCVIAANSVVKGAFGDNLVLAGAPARVVKSLPSQ